MKKFKDAFNGIFIGLKDNAIIMLIVIAIIVIIFSIVFLDILSLIIIIICCMNVIGFEYINSCIERLCDLYSKDYSLDIKNIKDLSAGATLIQAIFALIIGIIVLYNIWR